MDPTPLLIIFLLLFLALEIGVETLNLRYLGAPIPDALKLIYDSDKYKRSQTYTKEKTMLSLGRTAAATLFLIFVISFGIFDQWDFLLREFPWSEEIRGLIFLVGFVLASQFLDLPFKFYNTFLLEERYGFNRTKVKTFVLDLIKGLLLALLLGAPIIYTLLWIWNQLGQVAWLWSLAILISAQLFILFIAPITIMPLFNRYRPLPESNLRLALEQFAIGVGFQMKGLYVMDGSKRSTKSNAFFTGFGRFRRIVLFDTLLANHTVEEVVAVFAHEVGHYKLRHIQKQLLLSLGILALTLYLMSVFIDHPWIHDAFGMSRISNYAGFLFFSLVYSPISMLLSLQSLHLSRKYEFEADGYSLRQYDHPQALSNALKKLSANNLSNLTPHPLKVFLEYTHPPLMDRLSHMDAIKKI